MNNTKTKPEKNAVNLDGVLASLDETEIPQPVVLTTLLQIVSLHVNILKATC